MLLLFGQPVVYYPLWSHGLQHAQPLCPALTPGFCPSSSGHISDTVHHLILWCPLLLPSIFPRIRNFFIELSVCIIWPKYWNFSFQHQSFSEYSGLICLKIDWFDLLAVQGTFKSLLQHHSSKAPILWCCALFTILLSQPYITTGKTIALTIQTFVSRVMSQLFNALPRFVIFFLPRSNHLLISWLQSPSAVWTQLIISKNYVTKYNIFGQEDVNAYHWVEFLWSNL